MDFIDKIKEIAARIPKQLDYIQTEEATKNAFIMPFISALGYNVFDPLEVTPELCADVGVKKNEKVDYAILRDNRPIILFECKHHAADLSKCHASQLHRYFHVTEARFGALTNGIAYQFFTDLDAANKMDGKPFFEFNMLDIRDADIDELKKFSKAVFDVDNIVNTASELKYTREIKRLLLEQMQDPAEELIKFFAAKVYHGRMTPQVKEQFSQLTRQAFRQVVSEQINERLKTALASDHSADVSPQPTAVAQSSAAEGHLETGPLIVTTEEEMDAYHIVRAILREAIPVRRIARRDVQSYCGILLDDTNRKPICRLHFNTAQKYIGLFDEGKGDKKEGLKETRMPIATVDEIYQYADQLKATVAWYENAKGGKA